MVLEAPPDQPDAAREQRRGQRVAGMRRELPPVEAHARAPATGRSARPPRAASPRRLARQRRPRAPRGSRVSRTTRSQARQPPDVLPELGVRPGRVRPAGSGSRGTPPPRRRPPAAPGASPTRDRRTRAGRARRRAGSSAASRVPPAEPNRALARSGPEQLRHRQEIEDATLTVAACLAALLALGACGRERHRRAPRPAASAARPSAPWSAARSSAPRPAPPAAPTVGAATADN